MSESITCPYECLGLPAWPSLCEIVKKEKCRSGTPYNLHTPHGFQIGYSSCNDRIWKFDVAGTSYANLGREECEVVLREIEASTRNTRAFVLRWLSK